MMDCFKEVTGFTKFLIELNFEFKLKITDY